MQAAEFVAALDVPQVVASLEMPYVRPPLCAEAGAVDWGKMRAALGEERWRNYIFLRQQMRQAAREK